ncbi:flavodoxin family protein [Ornithinimicrobium avium]|uniref:Flavodoxin n=1 Tax=Ornithinimicrobium avium TaxID=2283195 RepID=A0A345NKS6_9MICO|nr:flavodoxin domain-containing protein [Ornithinimicrobium avium]AXH95634.1 flavodoxin [Ornithinimicrobium avium]
MKALIVYESAWGNTRAVAEALAAGLEDSATTEVVDVEWAPALAGLEVDLLVVGAPTHAFGLSRAGTRQDAHRRGGAQLSTGVREWLDAATTASLRVATFDTHVRHPNLPGSAARKAAKRLTRAGCTVVTEPTSFWVDDYEGPLLPGELDRAREWGSMLAAHLTPSPS